MILIDAQGVTMQRPGRPLFADASVTVSSGDRIGIVGLNGCGKSTLLSVLAGTREPEAGVVRRGRDVTVSVLDQDPVLRSGTVRDAVAGTAGTAAWEAESVLDRLGMGTMLDHDVAALSGGQRKRVALARALVAPADLLVLDEPTNHLDIDAIAWLEDRLAAFRGGLLFVTHDRHVLDRVTNRILEIDRGNTFVHDGGYDSYLEAKALREERADAASAVRRNLARREQEWLRRGAPARTRKSKARIERAEKLIAERDAPAARADDLDLHFGTPRLGDQVVELHDVAFGYPGEDPLFERVQLLLDRRDRLGIVGLNGTGKSTLLDLIAERIEPTSGTVVHGPTVVLEYYDQLGRELDTAKRVIDVVSGDGAEPQWWDKRLLERFWFDSDVQYAPIELLSGGERRRLQLLLSLLQRPNVLLLGEPTNDLDIDTLRVLEDFLEDWPGALVVVSHDRAFLERTVDDVLVLEGDRRAQRRPGGYAAWEERRRSERSDRRATLRPDQPKPAKREPGLSASKIRQQLKDVERGLNKAEKAKERLTQALLDAGTDHERMQELGAELDAVQRELDDFEEEWLRLSELQEGL